MANQKVIKHTVYGDNVDGVETVGPVGFLINIVYIVLGIIEILLFLRFALTLAGANAGSQFAHALYRWSAPFVAPFRGIFNINEVVGRARFEYEALIAMVVYALIAVIIVMILRTISSATED